MIVIFTLNMETVGFFETTVTVHSNAWSYNREGHSLAFSHREHLKPLQNFNYSFHQTPLHSKSDVQYSMWLLRSCFPPLWEHPHDAIVLPKIRQEPVLKAITTHTHIHHGHDGIHDIRRIIATTVN
jgi:hypothetical protein